MGLTKLYRPIRSGRWRNCLKTVGNETLWYAGWPGGHCFQVPWEQEVSVREPAAFPKTAAWAYSRFCASCHFATPMYDVWAAQADRSPWPWHDFIPDRILETDSESSGYFQ